MFKFNVGDRVKVLSHIVGNEQVGYDLEMKELVGRIFTVGQAVQAHPKGYYILEGAHWGWGEKALRRVRKAKIADAAPDVKGGTPLHITYAELSSKLTKATGDDPGTCSWAIQHTPDNLEIRARAACHAQLQGYLNKTDGKKQALLLNISGHLAEMERDGKGEDYLEYCRYILEESPHAKAFVYTSMEDAVKYGVFMNVNKSINQLVVAAVALREGSEFSSKLGMFCRLRKAGYCGHTAYLLSYCVSYDFKWQGFSDQHRTIASDCDAKEVLSFFKDGFRKTKDPAYKNSPYSYGGVSENVGRRNGKNGVERYFDKLLQIAPAVNTWVTYYQAVSKESVTEAALFLDAYFTN